MVKDDKYEETGSVTGDKEEWDIWDEADGLIRLRRRVKCTQAIEITIRVDVKTFSTFCHVYSPAKHRGARWLFSAESLCVCLLVNTITSKRLKIG